MASSSSASPNPVLVKNEAVYDPEKDYAGGCYMKPRHIVVRGTHDEMGYELAKIARGEYGVAALPKYTNATYGTAHRAYMERNFPYMAQYTKGVLRAFGLDEDDVEHDATQVTYDFSSLPAGYEGKKDDVMDFNFCTFALLPVEKTEGNRVLAARNFDLFTMNLWKGLLGVPLDENDHGFMERSVVIEKHPTDGGYKTILVGGMEMLCPWVDGMNEKGLYFTLLSDPYAIGKEGSPMSGGEMNGIAFQTLGPMILEKCSTVAEAKQEILLNRVLFRFLTGHMVLVDASGDGTIFEIDVKTQQYIFTDRKAGDPMFCTNHPVSSYPDPKSFPEYKPDQEMNTFLRMDRLNDTYHNKKDTVFVNKGKGPLVHEDAMAMMDTCHCAFVDNNIAQCRDQERTVINTAADLTKREIRVQFYVRDVEPISGSNRMRDVMTKRYTFGF